MSRLLLRLLRYLVKHCSATGVDPSVERTSVACLNTAHRSKILYALLYGLTLTPATHHTSRSVWEPIWEVDLPKVTYSEPGVRHTFIVPLSGFSASRMGRPVAGATLNATSIIGTSASTSHSWTSTARPTRILATDRLR